ncbi:MAG: hypothetical protein R2873_13010 [Caldilineaceae bacterium]
MRARNETGDWLQLQLTGAADGWGWVAARFVAVDVEIDSLPVSDAVNANQIEAQEDATPTPAAAPVTLGGVIVLTNAAGDIVLVDGESGAVTTLGEGAQPVLSPDGRSVLTVQRFGSLRDLVRIDVASGERQRLDTGAEDVNNLSPAWSPDGSRILFFSDRAAEDGSPWSLWIADSDGGNARQLALDGVDLTYAEDVFPQVDWR